MAVRRDSDASSFSSPSLCASASLQKAPTYDQPAMDSLSFIANLHATTLDTRPSAPLTLRPVRRHTRSSSISLKAKDLVKRSRSLFSSSSSSNSAPRTSVSSWTSRSEQEHAQARTDEQRSLSDQERNLVRTKLHMDERRPASVDLARKSREVVDRTISGCSGEAVGKKSSNATTLDPCWISVLIENGYVFPPRSSSHCDMDRSSDVDVAPSRASSILVHDLDAHAYEPKPCLTTSLDSDRSTTFATPIRPQLVPSGHEARQHVT